MLNNSPHTCLTGTWAHHHLHLATIKALNRFQIDASASLSNRQISAQTCTFLFCVWVWKRGKKTYLHAHKFKILLWKCNRCKRVSRRNVCVCRKSAYRHWSYSATLDNLLGVKNVTVCSFPPNFRRDRIPYEIIRRSAKNHPSLSRAIFPPSSPTSNARQHTLMMHSHVSQHVTTVGPLATANGKHAYCQRTTAMLKGRKSGSTTILSTGARPPYGGNICCKTAMKNEQAMQAKVVGGIGLVKKQKKAPRDEPDNGWCFTHS